jgi:hypothetical protein
MSDIIPEESGSGPQEAESQGTPDLGVEVIPARQRPAKVSQDESDLSGYALLYNVESGKTVPPLPKAHLTPDEANVYLVGIAGGVDGVLSTEVFTRGPAFDQLAVPDAPKNG